jgi:hypothetical protein
MFVEYMLADEWHDRVDHGTGMSHPTWEQVRAAMRSNDGVHTTIVGMSDKNGSDHYMLIAGHLEGRYLVNSTKDNREFFSLVDNTRSDEKKTIFVGGQNGEYEDRKLVPLAWALEAAAYFYKTGDLSPHLNWVSEF